MLVATDAGAAVGEESRRHLEREPPHAHKKRGRRGRRRPSSSLRSSIHPAQALREYRERLGIAAKLVVEVEPVVVQLTLTPAQMPVVGVPVPTEQLGGLDSLLSIAQMPGGVPVEQVGALQEAEGEVQDSETSEAGEEQQEEEAPVVHLVVVDAHDLNGRGAAGR